MFRPFYKNWRKYLIKTGYSCNNLCSFCHTDNWRTMNDDGTQAVLAKVLLAQNLGAEMVVFTGGEPTIRRDLFALTGTVKKLGMKLGLVSNGRLLGQQGALARLHRDGLRYTFLSLHGARSAAHNRMVLAGAYEQTMAGIRAVAAHNHTTAKAAEKIDLTVNCVLTRHNVSELNNMVDLLRPLGPITFKVSYMEPKGGGLDNYDDLALPAPVAAQAMRAAVQHAALTCPGGEVRVGVDGLTPCLFPGFHWLRDDLFTHGFVAMAETFEERFHPVDHGKRHYLPGCETCGQKNACPGVHTDASAGLLPVRPLPAPKANSVNFFLNGVVKKTPPPTSQPDCALGLADQPSDTPAALVVQGARGFRRAFSDTADFAPAALKDLLASGQVYQSTTAPFRDIHFQAHLHKLATHPACQTCPRQGGCTGAWQAQEGATLFTQADEAVKTLMAQLHGDVLEVGAGPDPYLEALRPLLRQGVVRQHLSLEPGDAPHPLGDEPGAQRLALPVEVYEADQAFDHILFLRSLNHLEEPEHQVRRTWDWLREGGEMLLVENMDFALVRPAAQKARQPRAGQGAATHGHYHSLGSDTVLSWLADLPGAQVLNHQPIGPHTANQWLLRVRKNGPANMQPKRHYQ